MNLEKVAHNIKKADNGIYYSNSNSSVFYPEDCNKYCLQIEQDSFWFNHRNNVIAESVQKHSADKVFFDIGGGNGFVSKRLQDDGIKTVLIEPGKVGAINAYERGVKNVLCTTLEEAKFVPNSIDSVGLFDVVEHIEDDYSFLSNINKYMKHDGYVYITVPAFNILWSNEDADAGHFKRYSTTELNNLLEKCGFSIIQSTYIFSILPLPIFLLRSLPSKLGLNKNSHTLEKHQNVHKLRDESIINKLMQKVWKWELARINTNKKIPIGGSCFVIGKK